MARMPGINFVSPRSSSNGRPEGPPRFLVVHYTAGSESRTSAEDGAAYDARRTDGTSSHFFCDRDTIIQCVDTNRRAHTARYRGNNLGIQIEQCGTQQTRDQWLDLASRPTIANTAKICAWAMREHSIPLARLVGRQVRTGKGICGHGDVSVGFPEDRGDHMDPDGSRKGSYPWDILFTDIGKIIAPKGPLAAPSMTMQARGPGGAYPIHKYTADARKLPASACLMLCAGTGGSQNDAALVQSQWVDYFVMMFRRFNPGYWKKAVEAGTHVLESHEVDGPLLEAVRSMASDTLKNTSQPLRWGGCITEQIWDIYQPTRWGSNY